jgi:HlyD family secretion protein
MGKPAWLARLNRPLYLLLAVALLVLARWGFWPRALPVEAAEVARGPLTVSFTEEGRTRLRDRYQVSTPDRRRRRKDRVGAR